MELNSRACQPERNTIQNLCVIDVCIVEPGRVNKYYASIWYAGMTGDYVLDR